MYAKSEFACIHTCKMALCIHAAFCRESVEFVGIARLEIRVLDGFGTDDLRLISS
jgi:hypothetical protein